MRCARCQHQNEAAAKFCDQCAAPLGLMCLKCGRALPPTAKFCSDCAHPTGLTLRVPTGSRFSVPDQYTPRHLAERILKSKEALEGERKHVTVLFADLKGSMELLADRDPEEAEEILDPVLESMIEAVHYFDGIVNQVMGDGIMALFGAPVAHEDHAVRACYAALRMQRQMARHEHTLRRSDAAPVQIRVGINSGQVVVRSISSDLHMDYSAVGETVHLAARMEQLAPAGSVLLTEETVKLAEGYIDVRAVGAMPVKGLKQLVETYELVGVGAARSRFQVSAARGFTRFVGREAELEILRQALDRAREGHGQIVAIVGEPGVGKSRLCWELAHSGPAIRENGNGLLVLQSGSVSYGRATPYLPVCELLKVYFDIQDGDEQTVIGAKITRKVRALDPALEPELPVLLALLDVPVHDPEWHALGPSQRRRRTLDAVKRLLVRQSVAETLLLIFEDLHWIDGETQALLDGLVERLPTTRVLLLVNYRPEYTHGWGSKTYYAQLRIEPLPPLGAEALLDALLGDGPDLGPLKRLLIERTEGNPFFLEEGVRSLVETGALKGQRGAYRLARPVQSVQLPATAQAVVAARIDRLSIEEKHLLQAASVVGKNVSFPLLHAVAEMSEDALRAGLARLQATEFIHETALLPDFEYTFKHALTHEVAYASLLQGHRRALHGRIVDAIEASYAGRLAEYVDRLGHHAFLGERWADAATYLRQAGLKAAGRSASQEAAVCFEQALAALSRLAAGHDTTERAVDLRLELQTALAPLGDLDRMLGNLREAARLAASLEDQSRLGRIAAQMTFCYRWTGDLDRGVESGERALTIASSLGDVRLEVLANFRLGQVYLAQGRYRLAIALSRRSLDILGDQIGREGFGMPASPAATSRLVLGLSLMALGQTTEAIATLEDGVRLSEAVGHEYSRAFAYYGLGFGLAMQGHFPEAVAWLERSVALFRHENVDYMTALVGNCLGWSYTMSGRLVEGRALLEHAEARLRAMRFAITVVGNSLYLGELAILEDRPGDATDCARRVLEEAGARGVRPAQAEALRLLGDVYATSASPQTRLAKSSYEQALALAEELQARPLIARCHLGLGRLLRRVRDLDGARKHLVTAVTMLREMDMQFWLDMAEAETRELTP